MVKNLVANLKKLMRWGPRGLLSYIKERLTSRILRRQLRRSFNRRLVPVRGVTVIGKLTVNGSNSKVLRDFVVSLDQAGIPYQTFDLSGRDGLRMPSFQKYQTPSSQFVLNRYDHVVEFAPSIIGRLKGVVKARIIFWEFDSGLLYGYPDAPNEDCIIAMSDFNVEYFRRECPCAHVVKILYPFQSDSQDPLPDARDVRRKYGLGPNDFVVYFNFDFGSGYNRKNPEGALRAFAKAFGRESSARLLLKTSGSKSSPGKIERLKSLANELGIGERLFFENSFLSQQDVLGLVNAADVYLSLHRGEGFGITLAEAMALGKPVVCTDWSATTEFCTRDVSFPVTTKLVKVDKLQIDHPYYHDVVQWAEADIDDAAEKLRTLYLDPNLRIRVGNAAREAVKCRYSTAEFKESVNRFLDY